MAAGVLDLELLAAYRKAKGEIRRAIADQLTRENTGLIKTLLDQIIGRGPASGLNVRVPGMRTRGFRDLEWDDAYGAAQIAWLKALDQFDPAKGRISGYLKMKIVAELQQVISSHGLSRTNRGEGGVEIALTGEQEVLDALGGSEGPHQTADEWEGAEDIGGAVVFGLVDVEGLEAANDLVVEPTVLERFVETRLVFRPAARVALEPLYSQWEQFAMEARIYATSDTLRDALKDRPGVRRTGVRVEWAPAPVAGLAGVGLRPSQPSAA